MHDLFLELCLPRQKPLTKTIFIILSHESNNLWFCQEKKNHHKKTSGVKACSDQGQEVGAGGWPLLAVMKERESITGSCVLYERDREGFTKKEVSWKRDSHSEIEASRPLESTLRLTPSCFLPFSICRYSTSSEDSVLFVFDVILLILLLRQRVIERKIPLVCSDHTATDGCWRGSTG